MKQSFVTRKWKRILSAGLSFAMTASLIPAVPVSAAPSDGETAEKVPVVDKTPVPDKAGSISMDQLDDNITQGRPFAPGTAGSNIFRIPAMVTMENGELLAIADTRYTQRTDGNGLDTMAAVSSDGGETWEYSFPFFFPDTYRDIAHESTAAIDPGLIYGPDGTVYCIADVYPSQYYLQSVAQGGNHGPKKGTGYVKIGGKDRLALTDDYSKVNTKPEDENDTNYEYYVGDFRDGYARILKRADNRPTDYAVDEWYNLCSVDGDGTYNDLWQPRLNETGKEVPSEVRQNVYYKDSLFHVYSTGYLWVITSKDNGRTWEHPKDIVVPLRKDDEDTILVSPGRGLTTSDGTLVIGLYYHGKTGSQYGGEQASLLYSSDNGETWQRSEDVPANSSENEIVELEDGTLRMFYRHGEGLIHYYDFNKNSNGGYSVGSYGEVAGASIHQECNLSAISYSKKINGKQAIIASYPSRSYRSSGKIFTLLVNDDKTMSLYHELDVPGGSRYSYSCLTELQDGSVGLLWEAGDPDTTMWYNRFDISELVPDDAVFTGLDGQEISMTGTVNVSIEKGDTYERTVDLKSEGEATDDLITTPPNSAVANAEAKPVTVSYTKANAYAYATDANNATLDEAFAKSAAQPESIDLSKKEFTFTKKDTEWYIQNEASEQYMTFNVDGNGTSYFSADALGISVTPKDDGTVLLYHEHPSNKSLNTYAILYKPYLAFNLSSVGKDAEPSGNNLGNFTLWKKSENTDGPIPGYEKAKISRTDDLAGNKYLITHLVEDSGLGKSYILLLNPENGRPNMTKLLVTDLVEPDPVDIENEVLAYAHCNNDQHRPDVAFGTASHSPQALSMNDMEFTFTKNASDDRWTICNTVKNLYMDVHKGDDYFSNSSADVEIDFTNADGTVKFHNGVYAYLWKEWMDFNGTGTKNDSGGFADFTLWKKTPGSTDGRIPGYTKLSATSENLNGTTCLIGAEYKGEILLLYPENGKHNKTKLFSPASENALPTYAYIPDSIPSSKTTLADTYKVTDTTKPRLLDPAAMEFTFKASGDKWTVQNKLSGEYLTIQDGKNMFDSTAADITATPQGNGVFGLGASGSFGFHTPWLRFDRNGETNNIILWEKDADNGDAAALTDEPAILGYHKVTAIKDGGVYLIGAIHENNIYLLYPSDGQQADGTNEAHYYNTKLLANFSDTEEADPFGNIAKPTIVQKPTPSAGITITGVNAGYTKAVIGGTEYKIHVTDSVLRKPTNEGIEILYSDSYDVSGVDDSIATVAPKREGKAAMYDHGSTTANSLTSFSQTENANIHLADAEFTFTQDSGDNTKWNIKNGTKYITEGSDKALFGDNPVAISVPQTSGADTFRILNENSGRYVVFYSPGMNINAADKINAGTGYNYEFTLWKKDDNAEDSILPGYTRLRQGDTIEKDNAYLITYVWTEKNVDTGVILFYPKGGSGVGDAVTKLAYRMDNLVTITPKTGGMISIVADGVTYKYQLIDPECAHGGATHVKGHIDADCETKGYTGDAVCDICDKPVTEGEVIPAGHDWGSPVEIQGLSDAQNGISLQTCQKNPAHQKKTIVYASAYKRLKELIKTEPAEISDASKALYKGADVTELTNAYNAGKEVSDKAASEQTNKDMYGSIAALTAASKQLHSHREGLEEELSWAVAEAEALRKEGRQSEALESAYDAVPTTEAAIKATSYDDLLEIVSNLKEACSSVNGQVSRDRLQALYGQHKDKREDDYSVSTWPAFSTALNNAKAALEKEDSTNAELDAAWRALTDAVAGLRTPQDEQIDAPGSIVYTAPNARQYPKAAAIAANAVDTKHAPAISDWTETTSTLVRNQPKTETAIVNKDGIWGFNDQLRSAAAKYDVNGTDKSMAITLKLWLNSIPANGTLEILAKGQQYSLQLKNGKLVMWMSYNGYPTEEVALNAANHVGKWLDVVMVINGNGKQRLYVNGASSPGNSEAGLNTKSEPFSLCYRVNGDGDPFTASAGYLADVKFYDCGTDDVSAGLTRSYEEIVSRLNAKTPDAVISAEPYDAKTVWSSIGEDDEAVAMDGTKAFAANTSYKATTTFTAHDYFLFPNTQAFKDAVAQKVTTGKEGATPAVTVSDDQKTMTVEVTYPATVEIPVTSIELNKNAFTLKKGTSEKLTATITPEYATDKQVLWTTSNPDVADVDSEGNVTAAGKLDDIKTATITATARGGQDADGNPLKATATVTVTDLDPDPGTDPETFTVTYHANADDKDGDVTGMPENASVESGTQVSEPEPPTLTGYTFKGWSETADGKTAISWPQTITGNADFYAIWEENGGSEVTDKEAKDAIEAALGDAEETYLYGTPENYEEASWNAFKKAYEAAKKPAAYISAQDLKKLADDLAKAQAGLKTDEDKIKENTQSAVKDAASKYGASNTKGYSKDTWAAYINAYNALAKAGNAGPQELIRLQIRLKLAIKGLQVDNGWNAAKKNLSEAVSGAKPYHDGKKKDWYTAAQWTAFENAYSDAVKYSASTITTEDVTTAQLDTKRTKLNSAKDALVNASKLGRGNTVERDGIRYAVIDAAKQTAKVTKGLNKKTLMKVNIPDTVTIKGVLCKVTEIDAKAFSKFTKIKTVKLGKNVTKIGNQSFNGCKSVTSLTINGTGKISFGKQSFNGCKKLKTITLKTKKVPTFGKKAFAKAGAKGVKVKFAKGTKAKDKKTIKSKLKKAGVKKVK